MFLGTGMGGGNTVDDGYRALDAQNAARLPPFSVLIVMANAAAAWVGIEHGFGGPNLTYSSACSSSAWRWARRGGASARARRR